MRFRLLAIGALAVGGVMRSPIDALANDPSCLTVDVGMQASYLGCHVPGDELRAQWASAPSDVRYMISPVCATAPDHPESECLSGQIKCPDPEGTWKYWVFRSDDDGPFVPVATTCLGPDEGGFEVITPDLVLAQMKRLTWPEAELTIQPPDGRTLVNLETNFFTTSTDPTTQTITLLGQRVDIEASPVAYTWHFGDGEQQTGTDPGAAYPALTITHAYREADVTVHPSLDVTYHGRYRVNDGPWRDIPQTLTVTGTPTSLQVLTATPHLVGREVKVNRLLLNNVDVRGVNWGGYAMRAGDFMQQQWEALLPHIESGAIDPPIGATYSLDETAQALVDLDDRRGLGKSVVLVR